MKIASEHLRRPLGAVPFLCNNVFFKGALQLFFGVHIEVVGGLVEDQEVGGAAHQFAEADFGLLAAGEDPDFALDVLGCEAAFGEGRADFVLGEAREFLPDLFDAGGVYVLIHFLLEIADLKILTGFDCARKGGNEAQEALEECCLADAV